MMTKKETETWRPAIVVLRTDRRKKMERVLKGVLEDGVLLQRQEVGEDNKEQGEEVEIGAELYLWWF